MENLVLQYIGNDSNDRPVYETENGKLFVDTDPRKDRQPRLCTKLNNAFDAEPDTPVMYIGKYDNTQFIFKPERIVW